MPDDVDDITRQALRDLGLQAGATATQIRHAFAQLALQHHPDHNQQDPTATARFQRICRAYEVLTHPRPKRAQPPPSKWPDGPYVWPPWGTPPPEERYEKARPDPDLRNYPSAADLEWLRRPRPEHLERRSTVTLIMNWVLWTMLACFLVAMLAWLAYDPHGPTGSDNYPERFHRQFIKRF